MFRNSATATTLATARTINGTSFNGSANITTANWGTARTLTIGKTGKSVNGSQNVSWSLSEIGALPLTGGTVSGTLTVSGDLKSGGMGATGNMWLNTDSGDIICQMNVTGGKSGALRSYRAATDDLGSSSARWRNVWASTGTIQTSDERYKTDIQDIDDELFFDMVKSVDVNTYVMLTERKDKMPKSVLEAEENKQSKASSDRVQVGIIAQDMARFDCSKFILVYDEESDIYSVNNYNFTSAIMAALKVEISKREELQNEVKELKELIKNS